MEAATMKKYNTFGVVLVKLRRQAASNLILSIMGAGFAQISKLSRLVSTSNSTNTEEPLV